MAAISRTARSDKQGYSESADGRGVEGSVFARSRSRFSNKSGQPQRTKGLAKRRKIALYFALALVFVRLSMIHQILEYLLHIDIYVLYFVAIPLLILIPLTGGFQRVFQYRHAWFWAAFALWLIPTSVFSTWKSGSIATITGFYRTELILLFAIGGLVTSWRECRWLMYTLFGAGLVNVVSVLLFRKLDESGRTSLTFGTVANSNDYSGHLIFVLPFLLWVVLTSKSRYLRALGLLAVVLALFEILAAGSRGAMIGLAIAIIMFTATATPKVRRVVLVAAPVLAIAVLTFLPGAVVHRIFLFSGDNSEISAGAMESSHDREQLAKDAIMTTIHNPLFGVGPGQFANVEGQQTAQSQQRLWYGAHNSFLQIASENGFPGFVFYFAGILSSLFLLNRTGRLLAGKPGTKEPAAAVLCGRISLVSFCATIFFLNFGYFFYLPALAGIAIAVAGGSKERVREIVANEREKLAVRPPSASEPADWLPEEPVQS